MATNPPRSPSSGAYYVLANYGSVAVSLPFAVLTARALGPEVKGQWSVLIQLAFFAELIGSWGIGGRILRDGRTPQSLRYILEAHLPVAVIGGLASSLALIVAASPRSPLSPTEILPFFLALLGLALLLASRPFQQATMSLDLPAPYAGSVLGQVSMQLLVTALLYWIINPTLTTTLIGWIVGVIVRLVVPVRAVQIRLRRTPRPAPAVRRKHVQQNVRFGLHRVPIELSDAGITRFSLVLLPFFASAESVGQWSVTLALFEVAGLSSMVLANLALGRLQGATAGGGRGISLRQTIGASVIIGVAVILAAQTVVPLVFGDVYRPAALSLALVGPWLVFLAHVRWRVSQLTAIGDEFQAMIVGVTILASSVVGAFIGAKTGIPSGPMSLVAGLTLGSATAELLWRQRRGVVHGHGGHSRNEN